MPQLKKHQWLANVGSGYADIAVGGLIILLLTPVVINHLGVDTYAAWIICHSIVFYLGFFDIGFGHAQVRFHARWSADRHDQRLRDLLSTSTAGLSIAGIAAAVLGLAIAWAAPFAWFDVQDSLRGQLRTAMTILALDLLLTFPGAVLNNLYYGAERFDLANIRSIALRLLTAAAQLACLLRGYGIVELAAIQLAMSALRIGLDVAILSKLLPGLLHTPVRFKPRTWRSVKGYALWSAFEDLLVDGSTQLEHVLIALLLPLALLTPYSLFTTAAGMLLLGVGPISETLLPLAARWQAERNREQLGRLLLSGSKLATAVAAPAAIFLWVFGDAALHFWSPDGVAGAPRGLLQLITLNFLASAFLTTSAMMLLATGRVRTIAILTLMEVAVGGILVVALVPRIGLVGVAAGLLAANLLLGFAAQVPIAASAFQVGAWQFVWKSMGRVSLAAAPAVAVAVLIRTHLDLNGIGGFIIAALAIGATYLVSLMMVGTSAPERAEYKLLWIELRK